VQVPSCRTEFSLEGASESDANVCFRPIADISGCIDGVLVSGEHGVDSVLRLLARWSGSDPLRDSARVRLICQQRQHGPYAYLHRLYIGLGEPDLAEIEARIRRAIPPRLREFYKLTNGARFFEGQVSVSGLVRDFSRDPSKHLPISIEQDNRAFAKLRPEWDRQGYFRMGGVSFLRQDELICGPDDRIIVLHERTGQPLRDYADVFACLESFTIEMGAFWTDEGVFTGKWDAIDHLLLGVSGSA